jgi:hypothetical protein
MSIVMDRFDIYTPTVVGFAGVDDLVSFEKMQDISKLYEVEWGVLVHPEKFGTQRYPGKGFILQLGEILEQSYSDYMNGTISRWQQMHANIHLCGEYVEMLMEDGYTGIEELIKNYKKIQVNLCGRELTPEAKERLWDWSRAYGKVLMLQVDDFPADDEFTYICDRSRGTGKHFDTWPSPVKYDKYGYVMSRDNPPWFAGGINPENVLKTCHAILKHTDLYNIDMETGVRDNGNEFSIAKCLQVCEALYGKRQLIDDDEGVPYLSDILTDEERQRAQEGRRPEFMHQDNVDVPRAGDSENDFIELEEGE